MVQTGSLALTPRTEEATCSTTGDFSITDCFSFDNTMIIANTGKNQNDIVNCIQYYHNYDNVYIHRIFKM